jgi:tight adherence protein B
MSAVVLLAGLALGLAAAARRAASAHAVRTRLLPPPATTAASRVRSVGTAALVRLRQGSEARRLDRELPLVLDEVARSLRAGCSLAQALTAAGEVPGPAGRAVAALAGEVADGRPVAAAADRWARASGSPVVGLAAVAVALAAEAGGTSARAVDGVAASLRERAEAADEAHALAAQARLSAVVIGVAPLAFAGLAAATDPRTATFLVGSPIGLACLVGGAALDGAALVWMRRIAASVA